MTKNDVSLDLARIRRFVAGHKFCLACQASVINALREYLRLVVIALALFLTSGCTPLVLIPPVPPPGAFFEWSDVRPSDIPTSRPLKSIPADWEEILFDAHAVAESCDREACLRDRNAWNDRCLRPRANAMAVRLMAHLKTRGAWHPQGFALLARDVGSLPVVAAGEESAAASCNTHALSQSAMSSLVQAIAELAHAEQAPACDALRLLKVEFDVSTVDRSQEGFGEFLEHDFSTVMGSAFIGILSGATVMPMGDMISRIVTITLTLRQGIAEPMRVSARGSASVKWGSGKVFEEKGPAPRELVPVAVAEAFARLDALLLPLQEKACRLGVD